MGGFITKIVIGTLLITMFTFIGTYFLTSMGNEYGITVEEIYNDKFTQSTDIQSIAFESGEIQEAGEIDNQATDTAQLTGAISAEKTKLNTYSVIKKAFNDIQEIIQFHSIISITILAILVTAFTAAGYSMLRGFSP